MGNMQIKMNYCSIQYKHKLEMQMEMDSRMEFRKSPKVSIRLSRQSKRQDSLSDYFEDEADTIIENQSQPKRKPIHKNTLSSKKKFKKQRIEDIFKSIIKTITFSSRKSNPQSSQSSTLKMPVSLVNTLYRQNIRNYNPYIATLEQLEQQKNISPFQKERISNLCHIGVAKSFIKAKKYSLEPRYVTVNVLIRTYMRDKMWEEVKYRQQTYDSVFFIPVSQLALNFNPLNIPKGLEEFMTIDFFASIINQVNSIITTEYVKYKSSNLLSANESLTGKLILGVLFILSLVFCFNTNVYLLPVIFGFGIIYILYLVFQCRDKLKRLVESKSVISTILERINSLFQRIRTDMIEWKVGKDFYWLQIHYIKKKKRNFGRD